MTEYSTPNDVSLEEALIEYEANFEEQMDKGACDSRKSSVAWFAELSTFPSQIDVRSVAEVLFGGTFATRYIKLVLIHVKCFIGFGVVMHIVGIGSISGYNDGLRTLSGGLTYSVWTYITPVVIVWYMMILLTMNYGLFKIVMFQFKPLYIMTNAAIFSIAITSYLWSERGFLEIPAKVFDLLAFSSIAFSDTLPKELRIPFCRYFLPIFSILYGLVFIPKLALNLDAPPNGYGHIRYVYLGDLQIAQNTTIGCQVLVNMIVWFCYISWNAFYYPDSFCLLLARVTRPSFNKSL